MDGICWVFGFPDRDLDHTASNYQTIEKENGDARRCIVQIRWETLPRTKQLSDKRKRKVNQHTIVILVSILFISPFLARAQKCPERLEAAHFERDNHFLLPFEYAWPYHNTPQGFLDLAEDLGNRLLPEMRYDPALVKSLHIKSIKERNYSWDVEKKRKLVQRVNHQFTPFGALKRIKQPHGVYDFFYDADSLLIRFLSRCRYPMGGGFSYVTWVEVTQTYDDQKRLASRRIIWKENCYNMMVWPSCHRRGEVVQRIRYEDGGAVRVHSRDPKDGPFLWRTTASAFYPQKEPANWDYPEFKGLVGKDTLLRSAFVISNEFEAGSVTPDYHSIISKTYRSDSLVIGLDVMRIGMKKEAAADSGDAAFVLVPDTTYRHLSFGYGDFYDYRNANKRAILLDDLVIEQPRRSDTLLPNVKPIPIETVNVYQENGLITKQLTDKVYQYQHPYPHVQPTAVEYYKTQFRYSFYSAP